MFSFGNRVRGFIPEGGGITSIETDILKVNTLWWGFTTSPIVGYFLSEKEARECFESYAISAGDPRWFEQSQKVLDLISDDHPVFVITKDTLNLHFGCNPILNKSTQLTLMWVIIKASQNSDLLFNLDWLDKVYFSKMYYPLELFGSLP